MEEIFDNLGLPRRGRVYLLGIGGIAVSSLAQWFLSQKWTVEGSDIAKSPMTEELRKRGINVKIGPQNRLTLPRRFNLVIYSQAAAGNRLCDEALARGIPAFSYPQFAGHLTRWYRTVAIAGAHGKSTTTAIAGLILKAARFDPTVIVGTKLREFAPLQPGRRTVVTGFGGRNFRPGRSRWLVLEADEYGRAFLNYSPAIALVTNIDREHLDTYKDLADIKRAFMQFLSNTAHGGMLVLNRDDKNLRSLALRIRKLAIERKLKVIWYSTRSADTRKIRTVMNMPGEHNVSNACATFALARALRIPSATALRVIGAYRSSWRRMEYRGTLQASGFMLQVFDDYAHHPTEIRAALAAFKEKYPEHPIICVFQPHQAKRLHLLWREFIGAFDDADVVVLLPLYRVAGRDPSAHSTSAQGGEQSRTTSSGQATSANLAAAIRKKHPKKIVHYLANPENLKKFLTKTLSPSLLPTACLPRQSASASRQNPRRSAVVVMMGAGDIVNYTDALVEHRA